MPCPPRAALLALTLITLTASAGLSGPASAAADPCATAGAIVGGPGRDTLTGTEGNDVICGLGGDDVIDGLGGNDTLVGGEGADVLYGRAGSDVLIGSLGADRKYGGGGTDTVSYADRTTPVTITLNTPSTGPADDGAPGELDRVEQVEHATGGSGADAITGDAGPNTLQGGAGDDVISGLDGNDDLGGSGGDDRLDGGAGADLLRCATGTDRYRYDSADTRQSCEINLTPGTGNLVVGIGDSNMAHGQQGYFPDRVPVGLPMTIWPGYVDPLSVLAQGVARAKGRALYGGGFGIAGSVTSTIFGEQLDRALARRPTAIVVIAGTNNITVGEPYVSRAKADYQAGVARIVEAGVLPILTTVLPRNDAKRTDTIAFNTWLRTWASQRGYPLADLHAALADANGRFKPGTNTDDLHLGDAGVELAATTLAATFSAVLPAADAALAASQGVAGDPPMLFGNPLFSADGDGDGRPDGVAGGAGLQLTTTTDATHALGRVLRAAHTGTNASFAITVPAVPGRRLYVSGRLRTRLAAAGGEFTLDAYAKPGYTQLWTLRFTRDLPSGSVLPPVTFTVPSTGAYTSVQFSIGLRGGGEFDLGQFTVADVTAPG